MKVGEGMGGVLKYVFYLRFMCLCIRNYEKNKLLNIQLRIIFLKSLKVVEVLEEKWFYIYGDICVIFL